MEDCVFCKIVNGDIDCAKVWEDGEFLAILDVNPNTNGMTLVIPKKHYESYVFDIPESVYKKLMVASRKVGKILEKGLNVKRVAMVMEGLGMNHAHIKLYPLHGLLDRFKEMWAEDKVFFEKYKGYLSTQLGPKKDIEELKKLAKEIRGL
ncbi:MAG: HIT domain-containing protein [Candidatus Aenigmarchaeota archaeon]|nr:HIT domain-containing protein [Candidatus Aenigmarchaeota archaeon]